MPHTDDPELQAKIEAKIKEAKDKLIFQKAYAVVMKKAKPRKSDITGYGETFTGYDWRFDNRKGLVIKVSQTGIDNTTSIDIHFNNRPVFDSEGKICADDTIQIFGERFELQIERYVGGAWLEQLDKLAQPMLDEFNKQQRHKKNKLKKSFGL